MHRNNARKSAVRGLVLAGLVWTAASSTSQAVVLDDESRLDVVLSDGTTVVLYAQAGARQAERSNRYYYLPVNLRLSQRSDGTPEFLFLKFTTEERADQGGVNGALIHFLMEWGLTPEQEAELEAKLGEREEGAELAGAVPMLAEDESGSFQVVSGTLSDDSLAPAVVTSGKAPLLPGGKVAAASRLTSHGAQLLDASFSKARSISDVSIALNFKYATLTPAANGRIVFDWSKYETEYDSLEAEYKQWVSGRKKTKFLGITISSKPTYSYSYDEMRAHYEFLSEKKVVRLEFDELVADERVAKIREAFFQFFLDSFTDSADTEAMASPPGEEEKQQVPNIRYGNRYRYKQTFHRRSFKRKVQTFDLNYRLSIRSPYQLVGNLASWYDSVRHNEKCVAAVNLNDPFYQHRDIHFVLDLDAKEMFDREINYVTVNVRKNRSTGRPFEDRLTIDGDFLKEHGINASLTYARGEDTNPDAYEYQAQWSLRGGNLHPADPVWQRGSWEGVTLAPPVVARTLELEADLGGMEASDVTRITAQIHYRKFGEEVEENIHISPAKGEPLTSRTIFIDRGERGYAYRLVVNHKTEGKLALPWSAQVGDDYIYAAIPPELLEEPELVAEAKEAARGALSSAKEKVLDQFKDVLGGGGGQ